MLRAILIDPLLRVISEVNVDNDLQSFYDILNIRSLAMVNIDNTNSLYIDDEGLLNNDNSLFEIASYAQPLAGRALVVAHNEEGETVETTLDIDQIRSMVGWVDDQTPEEVLEANPPQVTSFDSFEEFMEEMMFANSTDKRLDEHITATQRLLNGDDGE